MQITANSTIIYCAHWREAVHFYRDLLGLPVSFEKDDWFIELRVSGFAHLSLADAARCTIPAAGGAGITLSWCISDLHALRDKLLDAGVKVSDIAGSGWRLPYFYAWDPEGTRIEFWCMGDDQTLPDE